MFNPGGDYQPMDKDAFLFGGTDPGRFVPTYMIFCESRAANRDKFRDPNFDRRDVYIVHPRPLRLLAAESDQPGHAGEARAVAADRVPLGLASFVSRLDVSGRTALDSHRAGFPTGVSGIRRRHPGPARSRRTDGPG